MIYNINAKELFLPYIISKYELPLSNDSVTNLYFKIHGDDSLIGIEVEYIDADLFRKMEYNLRMRGLDIIDNTPNTIVIVVIKDEVLEKASSLYLKGKFSRIKEIKPLLQSYIKGKDLGSLREDKTLCIIKQDKVLRKAIEEVIGLRLPEDAELASIPDSSIHELTH